LGVFAGPTNSWINLNSSNSLNGLVRNGLVLALDAGRTLSYPGSGTTWTDLSGNGNTGTLTNGPTYSSANGGSLVFDGVDDYVNLGSSIQNYSTCFTTEPSPQQKSHKTSMLFAVVSAFDFCLIMLYNTSKNSIMR
jgi:hypothetical protein